MNRHKAQNLVVRYGWVLLVLTLLSPACVTETDGGLPVPASAEDRARAQLDLARGYLKQGDFARARIPLARALEVEPQNVEATVLFAVLFNAQKEYELAESYYQKALRIDPDNAQALNNYGSFLFARKRFADAIAPLAQLVQDTEYRNRSQAFENLGLARLHAGDRTAAAAAFKRSLELNSRQPRANLELADMAYDHGDFASASAHLAAYKSMAQQSARSLCLGLKVAVATHDADKVASMRLALSNIFPEQAGQCQAGN